MTVDTNVKEAAASGPSSRQLGSIPRGTLPMRLSISPATPKENAALLGWLDDL
jgi:hypothetical protein